LLTLLLELLVETAAGGEDGEEIGAASAAFLGDEGEFGDFFGAEGGGDFRAVVVDGGVSGDDAHRLAGGAEGELLVEAKGAVELHLEALDELALEAGWRRK
jgi:hypothetical protein